MDGPSTVHYSVDEADKIVEISDSWRDFVLSNGGPEKLVDVIGQPLWSHICDKSTRDLYVLLLSAVRLTGRTVSFRYRCDTPTFKRFMRMTLDPWRDEGVRFENEILFVEAIHPELHFISNSMYSIKNVNVCSVCRSVRIGEDWRDVLSAFSSDEIMANKNRFHAIYRICPSCKSSLSQRTKTLLTQTNKKLDELKEVMNSYHEGRRATA